jgi:hypothetical protein
MAVERTRFEDARMIRCRACFAVVMLLTFPMLAVAQTAPPAPPSGSAQPAVTQPPVATPPPASSANSLAGTARAKPKPVDPLALAAKQQSGLNEIQARTLLSNNGYAEITNVQPDPNSIWVWQAEAVKDGRSVRLGIDYRGKILVLSSGLPPPCETPGVNLGVGGFGVGRRLSDVSSCSR